MHEGRLFGNRNFLLLWQGQLVSQLGTQFHSIAILLWLKETTESATWMGLVNMASLLPIVLLGPFGGWLADRYSAKKILVYSDLGSGLLVLSIAALIFASPTFSLSTVIFVGIASSGVGVLQALFRPAYMSLLPRIVPANQLSQANGLDQSSFVSAQLLGQFGGVFIFKFLGAPLLFLFDGITYLISALSELFLKEPSRVNATPEIQRSSALQEVREGFRFFWAQQGLRSFFVMHSFQNFLIAPCVILLPFYVENTLHASIEWFGYLLGAFSIGTILGYVLNSQLALSGGVRSRWLMLSFLGFSIFAMGVGFSTTPWQALTCITLMGLLNGFVHVNFVTLTQWAVPEQMRGRTFALIESVSGLIAPLGMGLAGPVADLAGHHVDKIFVGSGIGLFAIFSIGFLMSQPLRHFLAFEWSPATTEGSLS